MKWYLLHPAAIHFPVVLLTLGLAVEGLSLRKLPPWLCEAASWLLWLGAASAWVAMLLGLLAEKTAPHIPEAWQDLAEHKTLAFWTVGLFTALSLWRWYCGEKYKKTFFLGWIIAAGVLLATAYHGGEVVYTWGMGVAAVSNSN